jgi:hypothetical protein
VVYLLVLLFPNSSTILVWEFYFLPFSVHVPSNISYVALLSQIGRLYMYHKKLYNDLGGYIGCLLLLCYVWPCREDHNYECWPLP